jgi:hypothetical protein
MLNQYVLSRTKLPIYEHDGTDAREAGCMAKKKNWIVADGDRGSVR